jgi:TrmH family RNA methyltransferase
MAGASRAGAGIRIVLCRPRYPENLGFACRAMKVMGYTDLAIVADRSGQGRADLPAFASAEWERAARATAVHAADVYATAAVHESLESAVAECSLVAGTSRVRGKGGRRRVLLPEEFARVAAEHGGRVALVFGNEATGLTKAELERCSVVVSIPAEEGASSLNLSHAVQVMTYVLHRAGDRRPGSTPVTVEEVEAAVDRITAHVRAAGGPPRPERFRPLLSSVLGRAGMTAGELRDLERLFAALHHAADRRSRGRNGDARHDSADQS